MDTRPHHRDLALSPGTRRILHLDVDAFLASVEQALHPELAGKPLVVGGSPRSRNLVMSCSYEARRFGIRPGLPLAEAQRRCRRAIFRDGDSQAANRLREEITRILLSFSPHVEVASIDDFFLDLTGTGRLHGAAFDTALHIQELVRKHCSLPLSIGVATNRLMARLAGKLAKPGGVAEILPGYERTFLTSLPVDHLPGVGHSIGARLERFSIRTVGELALVPREILFASFGRDGLVIYDRAQGKDESPIEATHFEDDQGVLHARPPRSLQRETTFEPEEGRREMIEAMLSYLVERATHRLRQQKLSVRTLEVRVRWVETRPGQQPGQSKPRGGSGSREREPLSVERRRTLAAATDATDEIWHCARELYRELPRKRALVKRLTLKLSNFGHAAGWQGRLFDEGDEPRATSKNLLDAPCESKGPGTSRPDRQRRLDAALDQLRKRHGFGRILRGTSTPLEKTHPLGEDGFRLRTPSLNQ